MKFKIENKEPIKSKREFLKNLLILLLTFIGTGKIIKHKYQKDKPKIIKEIEKKEKLNIIRREEWDDLWNQIKIQYNKKLGEKFKITIGRKIYKKTVNVLPYLNENLEVMNLKKVLKRCVIHHTKYQAKENKLEEIKIVRDLHITERNFNDIAYHYLITSDGTVFEGRPINRVGAHAGKTKEAIKAKNKHFYTKGQLNITPTNKETYESYIKQYIDYTKLDPDYGSVGIALCGDFTKKKPPLVQKRSLIKLLNFIKDKYDIPKKNIIYHREVKSKIVEASGLHSKQGVTLCPGDSFLNHKEINKKLNPDTKEAKEKRILLEK